MLMVMSASAVTAAEAPDWTSALDLYAKAPTLQAPGLHLTNGIVFCVVHLTGESGEKGRRALEGRAMLQTFALARNAFPGLPANVSLQRQTLENVQNSNALRYAVAFSEAELATKAKEGRKAAARKAQEEAARKEREQAEKKAQEEEAKKEREEAARKEEEQAAKDKITKSAESGSEATQAETTPEGVDPDVPLPEANKPGGTVATNAASVASPPAKNVRRNPTLSRSSTGLVIEDDQTDLLGE